MWPGVASDPGLARASHRRGAATTAIRRGDDAVNFHRSSVWGALGLTALLCGCASAPNRELGESQAALRAAEEVGAGNHPDAAYHLKLAEDQIAAAKQLMDGNRGERRMAKRHLQRAELDAELAIAYTRTADAEARAKQAWHEVQELKQRGLGSEQFREEMMRGSEGTSGAKSNQGQNR